MSERLDTREARIRDWVLGQIEDIVVLAVEEGIATKDRVRQALEEALAMADEPVRGDPGLRWAFDFSDDGEEHEG